MGQMFKKILNTLDDVFAISDAGRVLRMGIMNTKLFWRIYFWWGIRQARLRRLKNEKRLATLPRMTTEEYWESKHK